MLGPTANRAIALAQYWLDAVDLLWKTEVQGDADHPTEHMTLYLSIWTESKRGEGVSNLRAGCTSHYTLPDMSLCLPIWDPTPGGQTCLSCDTPQA